MLRAKVHLVELNQTLSVHEAAVRLHIADQTVRDLYDDCELAGYKVGTKRVIFADSVADFQERHSNQKKEPPSPLLAKTETVRTSTPRRLPSGQQFPLLGV